MEQLNFKNRILSFLKKYKYPVLIVLVGIVLILLPGKSAQTLQTSGVEVQQEADDMQKQLREILSGIRGAGRVEVLLTEARGEQIVYQTDRDLSERELESNTRTDTVLVTDSNRQQTGLVAQVIPPVYLGAIVVCQGADDPIVKLAIVEAVSSVTGLRSDKITVLKMK